MSWLFWKNKSPEKKTYAYSPFPYLLEDNKESFSFRNEELHFGNYMLVKLNTFATPYEFDIKSVMNFLEIEIFLRERILESLYKTLNSLHEECKEENFQVFSETARKNAKQILTFVYNNFPNYDYHVYPTKDREIAINCNPQKGKGISVLCDSDGGIGCFATFDGKNRRSRYSNIDRFLFRFLYEIFEELDIEKKHLLRTSVSSNVSLPEPELDNIYITRAGVSCA